MQDNPVESRVGYLLKQAQQALRTAMDHSLGVRGLTTPQYAVLSTLDERPGLSNAELARWALVTPQTMNSIVLLLEHAGLVQRQPHAEHGRILTTTVTRAGADLVHSCHEAVDQIEQRTLAPLTDAEQAQLTALLTTCAKALRPENLSRRQTV